ncbi:MAG: DNRLRE domain-containing protein [Candidatus Cloacimonadales bacterium]|nr:DNRLRE domain-containing protein [Candidatus Cloacimonadales bacterium]
MKNCLVFGLMVFCLGWLFSQEIQLLPCDDMYTDCSTAAHLDGDLFLNCEAPAEEEQIMLKFDFSGVQGIQFEAATLNLHRYFSCGGGGGTTTAILYLVDENWTEETWDPHTFIQYDSTNAIAYAFSGPVGTQNTWFEVDIFDFVDIWLNANQPNFGMVIIADTGQRHSKFDSKEAANADFHPYLNMTLATGTDDILQNPIKSLANFPNPFNPSTTIEFNVEQNQQNELIELAIYNLKGQKIKTFPVILSGVEGQTSVIWDGTDQIGKPVASGIYLYKIKSGDFEKTKKMILMK